MNPPRLNVIVDVEVATRAGWAPIDLAVAFVAGGARFVQLRAKALSGAAFLDLSTAICGIVHAAGGMLIVNDRADIARLAGADGVHVGQEDLSPHAVRSIVGNESIVGFSTHTTAQIDAAVAEPIDYVAVGPIFGSATKDTGYSPVGLERIRHARLKASRSDRLPLEWSAKALAERTMPVVAIGGITLDNAADVIAAGAASVAVISDLLATGDPERRVRDYLARLGEMGKV